MKTARTLSLFFAALLGLALHAQFRGTVDLLDTYGLTHHQSKAKVGDSMTLDAARMKYPLAAQVCAVRGLDLLDLSLFDAAWMDAVWSGQGGGQAVGAVLVSQNHVRVPAGEYWLTVPAEFSGGIYTGAGTGYAANGSTNTTLHIWHQEWNGDPMERHAMQSGTWDQGGIFSYVEATRIEGFQLIGHSREALGMAGVPQAFNSCGIRMWKPGEVTYTTDIFARDFRQAGIQMHAPTPHHLGTISVFDNVVAGIECVGCWGGTVNVDVVSGDDNGALTRSVPLLNPDGSVKAEGGGTWHIGVVKSETGVASGAASERVHRGQAVGEFHGQFAVHIGAVSAAAGSIKVDALFVVEPRLVAGWTQQSLLHVGAIKAFNYSTLVHDLRGARTPIWPSYAAGTFTWHATAGVQAFPTLTSGAACTDRLEYSTTTLDPTRCTPYRHRVVGPPMTSTPVYLDELSGDTTPQPCTWSCGSWGAWGAWSACANGQRTRTRTRTCTAGPAGCSGGQQQPATTETETEACGGTTPPAGVVATIAPAANSTANASVVVEWVDVRTVVFTGVVFNGNNYQRLAWRSANDARGLVLKPDGYFYTPSNAPVGPKLEVGKRYDRVQLDLPAAETFTIYLAKPGTGGALLFEAESLQLLK